MQGSLLWGPLQYTLPHGLVGKMKFAKACFSSQILCQWNLSYGKYGSAVVLDHKLVVAAKYSMLQIILSISSWHFAYSEGRVIIKAIFFFKPLLLTVLIGLIYLAKWYAIASNMVLRKTMSPVLLSMSWMARDFLWLRLVSSAFEIPDIV